MVKRIIGAVVVLTLAALLTTQVRAQAVTGTGIIRHQSHGGKWYIPVRGAAEAMKFSGQLGMVWDEPVYVTSISLTIFDDVGDSRAIPETLRIYTGPTTFYDMPFTPKEAGTLFGEYVLDFSANPIPAVNSYVVVSVRREDMRAGYVYGHIGVVAATESGGVTIEAVSMGTGIKDENLNMLSGTTVQLSDGTPAPTFGTVGRTHNGFLAGDYGSNGVLWGADQNGKSLGLTATYDEVQTIGSIGLAFGSDGANRYGPAAITVIGTDEDGDLIASMIIPINAECALYGRYTLSDDFVDVKHLTVEFVVPDNMPGDGWIGIYEFQAFTRVIPEPATMCLLALGGLAMLKRRK
jgi:hypothetical protein